MKTKGKIPYFVSKDTKGKRRIEFENTYLPSINYSDLLQAVKKEFPNTPSKKLLVEVTGNAWGPGQGSFSITVIEV